ncbi:hypothetical protein I7I48_08068 [Histoplasma ohiense]|nr:hypothetical protein I7I48_08068 [Histoplasma ohiense (nom. inval.)]
MRKKVASFSDGMCERTCCLASESFQITVSYQSKNYCFNQNKPPIINPPPDKTRESKTQVRELGND